MNLNLSNTLRRLRHEKNLTQEEVADRLGVSPQAISRWENGQAYPDIELIPRLAFLYGVTTDALFGIDRDTREGKRNAFWQHYEEIEDDEEALRHLEAGLTEFPDDTYLKRTLVRHYVGNKKHPISEKKLEQIREMVRYILAHSTDTDDRCYAVEMMLRVEDEDRLDEWTAHLPEFDYSLWSCLAARYFYRNETDRFNGTHAQNLLRNLVNFCLGCGRRRDAKHHRNAEASRGGNTAALAILDALRDTTTDIDAWLPIRAFLNLRLAAGCFGAYKPDEGYAALEQAARLYEAYATIPNGTILTYNTPVFDLITLQKTVDAKGDRLTVHCAGDAPIHYKTYLDRNPIALGIETLTRPTGWEWFNRIRDEERYRAIVDRLRALKKD